MLKSLGLHNILLRHWHYNICMGSAVKLQSMQCWIRQINPNTSLQQLFCSLIQKQNKHSSCFSWLIYKRRLLLSNSVRFKALGYSLLPVSKCRLCIHSDPQSLLISISNKAWSALVFRFFPKSCRPKKD